MLLPAALKHHILQLEDFGQPESNFRASSYELTQLGLLARGVDRLIVAEACNVKAGTMRADISRMAKREGLCRTAGCIAGAILTHQMEAVTCVPLLRTSQGPGEVELLMPLDKWNGVVAQPDVQELGELFTQLEAFEV
jgi:hypothetical protein